MATAVAVVNSPHVSATTVSSNSTTWGGDPFRYHPSATPFFGGGELGGGAMKISGRRTGLFFGSAAVVLLGVGLIGVGPAGAISHARTSTPTAVGLYNYTDGGVIT